MAENTSKLELDWARFLLDDSRPNKEKLLDDKRKRCWANPKTEKTKKTVSGKSKPFNMYVEDCEIPFFCSEAIDRKILKDYNLRFSIRVEKLDGEMVISHI